MTPTLCRAGRVILDWQQQDLAKKASLSLSAIKSYEAGEDKTRPATQRAIFNAFDQHGIEFPASGGVRLVDDVATIARFNGNDFIHKWNEDIYQACTGRHTEILTSSIGETLWTSPHIKKTNDLFLQWIHKEKITVKTLTPTGQKYYNLPKKCYRTVPPEMLGKITYSLYADRLAFILWKKKQVIVIRNASVVETFRSQFDYLWKMGKTIAD